VAFLAFPSVCYNLDLSSRVSSHSPGVNIYQDFLRVLQLRYEGTDRALGNMSKLMVEMNLEDVTSPATIRSESEPSPATTGEMIRLSKHSAPVKGATAGMDIVVSAPQTYIRMSYILDFFLSRGRFPMKEEIPQRLLPSQPGHTNPYVSSAATNSIIGGTGQASRGTRAAQGRSTDFSSEAGSGTPNWLAASTISNNATTSSEARINNPELSTPVMEDSFGREAFNSEIFSLEDFMTVETLPAIEQLQNMLQTYPGLP
jgi:hypothetical protein